MIIRCITNNPSDLASELQGIALPEGTSEDNLDITVGRHYVVYALKEDEDGQWYFVHTDEMNTHTLWWMPATLYEVTDDSRPKGWVTKQYSGNQKDIYSAYPSLFDWKIETGILDGDIKATDIYLKEAHNDPTFPSEKDLQYWNKEMDQQAAQALYEEKMKLHRERGYEYPQDPRTPEDGQANINPSN